MILRTERKVDVLMGFLDKLNNLLQNTLTNQAPLTDPTERKYYEIAFNVLRLIHVGNYQAIKKYVDFTLGMPCDEERLKGALKHIKNRVTDGETYYLNYSDSDLQAGKNKEVCEISKEILKRVPFAELSSQKAQAFCVCFDDQIDHIKSEIAKALDMPLETASKVFLNQAIGKIKADLKCNDFLLYLAFKQSFLGDNGVKDAVVQHYFNVLERRAKEKDVPVYFGSMALKAANFESFGEKEKEYQTLSESECTKYIKNHDAFAGQPFDEYPLLIVEFVAKIQKSSAFYDDKTYQIFDLKKFWDVCSEDDYFMDAVCYSGWLKIKEQYDDEATTINEMADMMYDFALNPES